MKRIEIDVPDEKTFDEITQLAEKYDASKGEVLLACFAFGKVSPALGEAVGLMKELEYAYAKMEFLESIPARVSEGIRYLDEKFQHVWWLAQMDLEHLNVRGVWTNPLAYVYEGNAEFSLQSNESKTKKGLYLPEALFDEDILWEALTDEWKECIKRLRTKEILKPVAKFQEGQIVYVDDEGTYGVVTAICEERGGYGYYVRHLDREHPYYAEYMLEAVTKAQEEKKAEQFTRLRAMYSAYDEA